MRKKAKPTKSRAKILSRITELGGTLPADAATLPALELVLTTQWAKNDFKAADDWQLDHFGFVRKLEEFPSEDEDSIAEMLESGGYPDVPYCAIARSRFKVFLVPMDCKDMDPVILEWDYEDPDFAETSLLELLQQITGVWKPS